MQIYPAIKAKMGRWDYFMVRMSMRELAENVKFAEEIHGANHLSEAIQRELRRARATREIAGYLAKQKDRFFSSIVVAALDGDPQWYPVSLEADPQFNILRDDKKLSEAFGVLKFNGEQNYYALDGQHRLAAIRALIEGETEFVQPEDFRHEEVPVIIVMPRQLEEDNEFMIRYRRLFGHLNRYAKAMSKFDSIVMDEDDALAIITRRLVTDHEFFSSVGNQFESSRIKMSPGKNITAGSSHWTSFEMLYVLNIHLLFTAYRRNNGWGQHRDKLDDYKRFRPDDDEEIDALADELFTCWTALLDALPVLRLDPSRMRIHNPESEDENGSSENKGSDNVLFWPITQELLVQLARSLLDDAMSRSLSAESHLNHEEAKQALEPLNHISWGAHQPPWRHILLVKSGGTDSSWRIANEERKDRIRLAERIIRWQLGLDQLAEEELTGSSGLRAIWHSYIPADALNEVDMMWSHITEGVLS